MVDKIACCSCTGCPLPIVLRLFIADTISSATVCSQYVKTLRTRQKHGKFYCHNYGTTARPTKNLLTRLVLRQLAKVMFPGLHCIAEPSLVPRPSASRSFGKLEREKWKEGLVNGHCSGRSGRMWGIR